MTPKEYVDWFYEKFNNSLEGHHSQRAIDREKLDQEMIVKLIIDNKCENVLEIGTWEGQTGLLIWLLSEVKKFVAIDINNEMDVKTACTYHIPSSKEFIGHYLKDTKTKLYFIDTMKWEPEEWQKEVGQIDLVFIDGSHDVEHVKNDTLKSLKLHPKIIVWHDVNHDNSTDQVPTFLNEFVKDNPQYIIQTFPNTEIGYLIL
jgi:predicted O-methyltransferase YrrM